MLLVWKFDNSVKYQVLFYKNIVEYFFKFTTRFLQKVMIVLKIPGLYCKTDYDRNKKWEFDKVSERLLHIILNIKYDVGSILFKMYRKGLRDVQSVLEVQCRNAY